MDRLRTFGIVAHIDAGKTTLTERILHDSGAQAWVGSVDDGTATMDWMPEERSRGISITAAATRVDWAGHVLQVVDTPGHVDFVAEVERCLFVLDGVVVVVDAVRGVESQTEAVWQQAVARNLPRLVFVNKLDRVGADFAAVTAELRQHFDCVALPFVVPLADRSGGFAGLADALTGAVQWFAGSPEADQVGRFQAAIAAAHERLVEAAADADESILAQVVAGDHVPQEELRASLRAQFLVGRIVPVFCGAALWNRGVDWLLDGVVALMPRLVDLPREGLWALERAGDPAAPFCGLVFKVQHGDSVWNFVRVVRGRLAAGARCSRGQRPGAPIEVGELWVMQADRHRAVEVAVPGEIVVLPGELGLRTGDTICAPTDPVTLPVPKFPAPVLAVTFEPKQAEDSGQLMAVLREMAIDDPTLRVDRENGQIVVRGMGELHLEVVADRARTRLGADFHRSRPRVDRRETVRGPGLGNAEVRAMVGGTERWARCRVAVAPGADAAAPATASLGYPPAPGGTVALEEIGQRLAAGSKAGPMVGVRAIVEEVALDEGGLVEPLLQQAAARALAAALERAGVAELEPWVVFEIWCPEECSPAVLADLGARGALVSLVSSGRLGARLSGRAALARMLGHVTKLRSMTRGRGQLALRPAGFAVAPDVAH